MPLQLPEHFGRYRIVRRLGSGGMGTVYLAQDSRAKRHVALKVPSFSADEEPEILKRFQREAEAAARLSHPYICPVYDVDQIDGIPFFTMAYVDGPSLQDWAEQGQLPAPQVVLLVRKVADALQEAHRQNIIHRDVKPKNIMLTRDGEPMVMDFGLATLLEDTWKTQPGIPKGTPAYAAPEQANGEAPTPASDIYSLGVIFYELLTGKRPFPGANWLQVIYQRIKQSPLPPSQLREGLDPALDALCLRALETLPSDRYPSMAAFSAALSQYLEPRGVSGARPGIGAAPISPGTAVTSGLSPTPLPVGSTPDAETPASSTPKWESFVNSIGMRFVLVPAGTFLMGSPGSEAQRRDDEGPQHEVVIPQAFHLGIVPVTQAQYSLVMGRNPAHFQGNNGGPEHPVEKVSWWNAVEFCKRLSALSAEKETGRVYRLPTEAEWEYACRAGTWTAFCFGGAIGSTHANFEGWYPYGDAPRGPDRQATAPVGSYPANAFGLYDMHGNVAEWCHDFYDAEYYRVSPRTAPKGPSRGDLRVLRGGSWIVGGGNCRSASRDRSAPEAGASFIGFRVHSLVPARAR
jgi:formylglycine-generating enzyme required for sulfatase activity/predicted Ser/Thr protein kinase